jgi:G:T-mismatch repair DNA endonuclease (very short patch repair protein)
MGLSFKLQRICPTCGMKVSDKNKSGYCNKHRDRTGVNNPFYGKTHKKETIEASKIKISAISKKLWENPEYRNNIIAKVSKPRRESFKKEQSDRITQWYIDNPNQIERRRITMMASWDEGRLRHLDHAAYNSSKGEKALFELLHTIFGEYVEHKTITNTVNDGHRFFIPDAICLGDSVIEYYGDYWHANPTRFNAGDIVHHGITAGEIWERDRSRIDSLENLGYHVYIVWEHDFKENKMAVMKELDAAINWDACSA